MSEISVLTTEDEIVEALTEGQKGTVITKASPFYGTMGGQTGDSGIIENAEGRFRVLETIHLKGGKLGHVGYMEKGMLSVGASVELKVDAYQRERTAENHSATHLLQKALRTVLGDHVEQAGALYDKDRLRFDFTHFAALSREEIRKIEDMVNAEIAKDLPVSTDEMSLEDAKKTGAIALFGEKYGDTVRVVRMGDFSSELCGGTHVSHTGAIGKFKIISEGGIAAGVRRIEALTGDSLMAHYEAEEAELNEIAALLKAPVAEARNRVEALLEELRALSKENEGLKLKAAGASLSSAENDAVEVKGIKVLCTKVQAPDQNSLRNLGDELKSKLSDCVVVLISENEGKLSLLATATDSAVGKGIRCGDIIKAIAPVVGGKGGGRPNMAQAGGSMPEKADEALSLALETAKAQLGA